MYAEFISVTFIFLSRHICPVSGQSKSRDGQKHEKSNINQRERHLAKIHIPVIN